MAGKSIQYSTLFKTVKCIAIQPATALGASTPRTAQMHKCESLDSKAMLGRLKLKQQRAAARHLLFWDSYKPFKLQTRISVGK